MRSTPPVPTKNYIALDGFIAKDDGREVMVREGQVLPGASRLVRAHPELFTPVDQSPDQLANATLQYRYGR